MRSCGLALSSHGFRWIREDDDEFQYGLERCDREPAFIPGLQSVLCEGSVAVFMCKLLVGNFRFDDHVIGEVHVQALQPLHALCQLCSSIKLTGQCHEPA